VEQKEPFVRNWIICFGCLTGLMTIVGLMFAIVGAFWALVAGVPIHPIVKIGAGALVLLLVVSGALALWLKD